MKLIQLSLLIQLLIIYGLSIDFASGSNYEDNVADLIDKMEDRLVANNKERYDTLINEVSKLKNHTKLSYKENTERLDAIELAQRVISNTPDEIVDRLEQLGNHITESRNISQCDAANLFSRLPLQFDYFSEIKDCSANPHLPENPDINGREWITIQRRKSFHVTFNRNWADYKNGFGSKDDDFWLGLETLHKITSSRNYELRVVLTTSRKSKYALYSSFSITDENDGYRLKLGKYIRGNAGDSLILQRDMKFSTPDRDNDQSSNSCAKNSLSGWWFRSCGSANLNTEFAYGKPYWSSFFKTPYVSTSEMKIRQIPY